MFIQILIIFFICYIAIRWETENVLLFILFFLPFQSFIKSLFDIISGSIGVISIWKELAFTILTMRVLFELVFNRNITLNKDFPIFLVIILFLSITIMFLFSTNKSDAMVSYKNFTFPLIVSFTVSHLLLSDIFQKKILRIISYSAILVFAISHVQQYILKIQFAFLMNLASTVSDYGHLVFNQSASKILGFDRMYGPFVGPNELGLYTSIIIILFFFIKLIYSQRLSKYDRYLFTFVLIFGIITILQTFSRVSWAIVLSTVIIISLIYGRKKIGYTILLLSALAIGLFYISKSVLPDVGKVFDKSITLQEGSASGRPYEFLFGMGKIMEEPLGYGLGTVQYASSKPVFHTEIFWWIVLGELGIIVGGIYFFIYLKTGIKLFLNRTIQGKNIFLSIIPIYVLVCILAGFGSAILFEPIFQVYLWSFVGLAYNKNLFK